MKTRFVFFLCLLLSASLNVQAQVQFGVKAGLSTEQLAGQNLTFSADGFQDLTLAMKEADYGIQAGAFLRIPLSKSVFLQPELLFNSNSNTLELDDPNQDEVAVIKDNYQHLNVPLLVGVKLGPLRAQAGPTGNFFLHSANDLTDRDGWDATFDSFNVGYQVGGSIDIWRFTVDARYDGNFGGDDATFSFAGQDLALDRTPSRWVFTLGLPVRGEVAATPLLWYLGKAALPLVITCGDRRRLLGVLYVSITCGDRRRLLGIQPPRTRPLPIRQVEFSLSKGEGCIAAKPHFSDVTPLLRGGRGYHELAAKRTGSFQLTGPGERSPRNTRRRTLRALFTHWLRRFSIRQSRFRGQSLIQSLIDQGGEAARKQ